tara:strand:- start:13355 stop:13561 length:207 start_codon:yes stop_codon:yes gene_type:complete
MSKYCIYGFTAMEFALDGKPWLLWYTNFDQSSWELFNAKGIGRSRAEMEIAKAFVNPLLDHSQTPLAP